MDNKEKVSFLIITLNEEKNIRTCLESIKWSDDIAIVDSGSTDKTLDICKEYESVSMYYRKFDNYADQRNWLIDTHNFKNDWIFIIDADEALDEGLTSELQNFQCPSDNINAYSLRRKNFFMGKYMKYCGQADFYIPKLFRKGKGKFQNCSLKGIEKLDFEGDLGRLNNYLYHNNDKGLSDFIAKHNKYSDMESHVYYEAGKDINLLKSFLSKDPMKKEKFLKDLMIALPFKGFVMFFYLYIFKRGFLDGREGFIFCMLKAFYFFMLEIKVIEIKQNKNLLSTPEVNYD